METIPPRSDGAHCCPTLRGGLFAESGMFSPPEATMPANDAWADDRYRIIHPRLPNTLAFARCLTIWSEIREPSGLQPGGLREFVHLNSSLPPSGTKSPSPKWHWLPMAKGCGGFGWQKVICSIRARPRSSCSLRRRQKLSARMNRVP